MNGPGLRLRRIVVTFSSFEASAASRAAIDSLVDLARWMQADLSGRFIEDADLLAAAGLSFVREWDRQTRTWLPLSEERVLGRYAAASAALRRALEQSAARSGIPAEFAVVRGKPEAECEPAAEPTDLVTRLEPATDRRFAPTGAKAASLYVVRDAARGGGGRAAGAPILAVIGSGEPQDDAAVAALAARIGAAAEREVRTVDAARSHPVAEWWFAQESEAEPGAFRRIAARSAVRVPDVLETGLPPSALVVVTRTALERYGLRRLAQGRPEPWLVVERSSFPPAP